LQRGGKGGDEIVELIRNTASGRSVARKIRAYLRTITRKIVALVLGDGSGRQRGEEGRVSEKTRDSRARIFYSRLVIQKWRNYCQTIRDEEKRKEEEEKGTMYKEKYCFPHAEYIIVIMSLINCFLF